MKAAVAAFVFALSVVQSAAAEDDFQIWAALSASGPARHDSRLLLSLDGNMRWRDNASDLNFFIIRPGAGWKLNGDVSLWAGYAYSVAKQPEAQDTKEHRLWQQASYQLGEALGGALSGRTRLEQRFFSTGDDTGWRLRQQVRYVRPLSGPPLSLVLSEEIFFALNSTDWGASAGYDQSRTFFGLGIRAAESLKIETGYRLDHIRRERTADAINQVMLISFSLSR
ncbi:DUF2490 domain-containing protein [Hyphococcus sp.]|uniref:DUF2490 domain-containing protein n=1 Tax=Hyphococcus sp. TaxID=2038636 RepID=UPI003D14A920